MAAKAVFLDRDDTITVDPGYLASPEQLRLAPGAAAAMKTLKEAGYLLICVTNQSGIARGLFSEEQLRIVHEQLNDMLAGHQAGLDAIYYCPYHPEGTVERYARASDDRKPAPGMLLKAAEKFDIDLAESWMVGDRPADIEAGRRAGCRTIRVLTGKFGQNELKARADFTAANMTEAARIIMAQRPTRPAAQVTITKTATRPATSQETEEAGPSEPPKPTGGADSINDGTTAAETVNPSTPPETPATPATPAQPAQPARPEPAKRPVGYGALHHPAGPEKSVASPPPARPGETPPAPTSNNQLLQEILVQMRQLVRMRQHEEFSLTKLLAGLFEGLALLTLVVGILGFLSVSDPAAQNGQFWKSMGWLAVSGVLQVTALSFFTMGRRE